MAKRILITDANTPKALAITRSLGKEYDIYAASSDIVALASFSKYCKKYFKYKSGSGHFVNTILKLCKDNSIDVLITPEEESSFLVAKEKELFNNNDIITTIADFDAIRTCMTKPMTLKIAEQTGVTIPKTEYIESPEDAFEAAERIGYPVVVRPISSHYWTGSEFVRTGAVSYAKNPVELEEAIAKSDPRMPLPFLQEFIEGSGMSVLLAMDKNSEICAEAAHRGIREYRPTGGTLVVRESLEVTKQLHEHCARLLKGIGYRCGVLEVEFRYKNNVEDIYLMEINPRFWASVQGPIDAGVDFPKILVKTVLDEEFPRPDYHVGYVSRWWLGDLIRFIRILKGKPRGFEGQFPSRWKGFVDFFGKQPENSRNEVCRMYDFVPAIVEFPCMLIKYSGRFYKK